MKIPDCVFVGAMRFVDERVFNPKDVPQLIAEFAYSYAEDEARLAYMRGFGAGQTTPAISLKKLRENFNKYWRKKNESTSNI